MMNKEEWLAKLISFDTTSCHSNLPLINYIANWFEDLKVSFSMTFNDDQTKANLFATLPACDHSLKNGLILSGHTDVVPVNGQKWNTDPFVAIKIDDRIYGRGASDMKGFIAVFLSLLPGYQKMALKRPLHIALSFDEEVGCLGVPLLIADIRKQGFQPAACIVGEPTEMAPVVAHKGIHSFKCSIHGLAAHSSLTPQGCNSIEHGNKMIGWLSELGNRYKKEGPYDQLFDVPFTSLATTMIKGGNAINTIPDLLEFCFEFRNLPEEDPDKIFRQIKTYALEELLQEMRKESTHAAIEIKPLSRIPAFQASDKAWITKVTKNATQKKVTKVSYATEAGQFQNAGIPTIVCGPGRIQEAHKPNEYVTLEQLNQCERFLRDVVNSRNIPLPKLYC